MAWRRLLGCFSVELAWYWIWAGMGKSGQGVQDVGAQQVILSRRSHWDLV